MKTFTIENNLTKNPPFPKNAIEGVGIIVDVARRNYITEVVTISFPENENDGTVMSDEQFLKTVYALGAYVESLRF